MLIIITWIGKIVLMECFANTTCAFENALCYNLVFGWFILGSIRHPWTFQSGSLITIHVFSNLYWLPVHEYCIGNGTSSISSQKYYQWPVILGVLSLKFNGPLKFFLTQDQLGAGNFKMNFTSIVFIRDQPNYYQAIVYHGWNTYMKYRILLFFPIIQVLSKWCRGLYTLPDLLPDESNMLGLWLMAM